MNTSLTVPAPTSITVSDVIEAKLPVAYEAAQKAIAECYRMDECKGWADKHAALASYARQANDDSLRVYAVRIQDRAVRRLGELAKQFEPNPGARTDLGPAPTRGSVAEDAGISARQLKTAVRVANVPESDFERQVQSDDPPSVTALANQGKASAPLKPRNGKAAWDALNDLNVLARHVEHGDARIVASLISRDRDRQALRQKIAVVDAWLDRLVVALS